MQLHVSTVHSCVLQYVLLCVLQSESHLHWLIVGLVICVCLLRVDQCCQQHSTSENFTTACSCCYIGFVWFEAVPPACNSIDNGQIRSLKDCADPSLAEPRHPLDNSIP